MGLGEIDPTKPDPIAGLSSIPSSGLMHFWKIPDT
jgi:hypothetical protein